MDKEGHDPWIKRDTTHGYRGTQPIDKEGHNPWIKRDTTHG
jgi:hypothetical protein